MKKYSLSTLFHFTKTKSNLLGILKEGFNPQFCMENIIYGGRFNEFAIPMVSFCDIRLSQIKDHIKNYGSYGIGLSKEWAENKGLNPILYLRKNSYLSNNLSSIKIDITSLLRSHRKTEHVSSFLYIFRYLKNYEGNFLKGKKTRQKIIFYDEKEWRYVPSSIVLKKESYENGLEKAIAESNLEKLSFEPKDIKYIIIKKDTEINKMIDTISKFKYDYETVKVLCSRIITSEQIFNDF